VVLAGIAGFDGAVVGAFTTGAAVVAAALFCETLGLVFEAMLDTALAAAPFAVAVNPGISFLLLVDQHSPN
jgi:hypothetical protein